MENKEFYKYNAKNYMKNAELFQEVNQMLKSMSSFAKNINEN